MGLIMPLNEDISNALVILEQIQSSINQEDDVKLQSQTSEDLNLLISFLENPIFRGVAAIQDSLGVLSSQIQQHPSILPIDFDLTETGDLILNLPPPLFEPDFISTPSTEVDDQRVPVAKLSQSSSGEPNSPPIINQSLDDISLPPITTPSYALEFQKAIDESSEGRDVITVKLYKPEGCSLGFSVVGLRSEEKGELGIFIQEIQVNGIAGRDGRLHEGDQILAIDGQPLDSNISHEQAISILQKARGLVELVVARSEELPPSSLTPSPSPSALSETSKAGSDMVLNTEWAQVEVIDLINDGSGLGFGIIGGRSTGVVVKTILPGGVADRNGRLQSGDHILQIGEVNLRGMGSEQVAAVLRQSGSHVRLVVARPVEPTSPDYQALGSHAPIVPTKILADPEELDRHLVQNGYPQVTYNPTTPSVEPYDSPFMIHQDGDLRDQDPRHLVEVPGLTPPHLPLLTMDMLPLDTQLPEMERFTVELKKDIQGLGITIAGYVCEKEELSGIFVKSISPGSAADLCKMIQVNDRIVEVDGQSLQGYTNHDAVEVLRSTGGTVRLSLERYLRGPKFEQLQQAIANSELKPPTPSSPSAISLPRYPISVDGESAEIEVEGESITTVDSVILNEAINPEVDLHDIELLIDEDYEGPLKPSVEAAIKKKWADILGPEVEIVVGQLKKFGENKGLGISLEGTVDVEDGQEVRPHHYIRSILPEGPVGMNGRLRSGDELLEVNGHRLLGMNHIEVVTILKELPVAVRMVCARRIGEQSRLIDTSQDRAAFASRSILGGSLQNLLPAMERLVKAKSDGSLASTVTAATEPNLSKLRSRSLEPITGLAMWSSEPHIIDLVKGERGLGFSILDYQDPMNPSETVIVIRSLVPGGVAQLDGRLIPGDRLLSVNSVALDNASLDQAVQALKGAPKGIVRIAVAKPLPIPDSVSNSQGDETGLSEDTPTIDDHSMYSCSESLHSDNEEEKQPNSRSLSPKDITKDVEGEMDVDGDFLDNKNAVMETPIPVVVGSEVSNAAGPLNSSLQSVDNAINGSVVTELVSNVGAGQTGSTSMGDLMTSVQDEPLRSKSEEEVECILERADKQNEALRSDPQSKEDTSSLQNETRSRVLSPLLSPLGFESASDKESEYVDCDWIEDRTYYGSPIHLDDAPEKISSSPCESLDFRISKSASPPDLSVSQDQPIQALSPSRSDHLKKFVGKDFSPTTHFQPLDSHPLLSENIEYQISKKVVSPLRSESVDYCLGQSLSSPTPSDTVDYHILKSISKSVDSCCAKSACDSKPVFVTKESSAISNVEESTLSFSDDTLDSVQEAKPVQRYNIFSRERSLESLHSFNYRVEHRPELSKGISEPILNSDNKLLDCSDRLSKRIGLRKRRNMTVTHSGSTALLSKHWGPQRYVKIFREPKSSLGISIVGGKVDLYSANPDGTSVISGIFIKNVLPESPAGRTKELQTGDRILEVDGIDLRLASHERAVEVIRAANNPVVFLVQSLVQQITDGEGVTSTADFKPKLSKESSLNKSTEKEDKTVPVSVNEPIPKIQVEDKSPEVTGKKPPVQSSTSSEESDDDDFTNLEGMMRTPAGMEISRASAGNVKRSKEEIAADPDKEDEFGYTTQKVKKKYGSLAVFAELERGPSGLGISLAGHKDRTKMAVLVCGLNPSTIAYRDGTLQIGDEIVEVNGIVVHGRCHLNASAIIKGLPGPSFKIVALRKSGAVEDLSVKPITQFPISLQEETPEQKYSSFKGLKTVKIKKSGQSGLGIMIIEGKHAEVGQGIFISDIQDGSPADQAGLSVGDMILAVNKDTLLGSNYETAASLLKKTEGIVTLVVCNPNKAKEEESKQLETGFPSPGTSSGMLPTTPKSDKSGKTSQAGTPKLAPPGSLSPSPSGKLKSDEDNAAATAPVVPGIECTIEINKEKMPLGLSIVGGSDTLMNGIVVHDVYPDGASAKDGRLRPGDQLLEVNNEDFKSATNAKALSVLRQAPSKVRMVVYREDIPEGKDESHRLDLIEVELMRKPGKGLGLSIVGRKIGSGIFISDIVTGGVAFTDGRLMKGDQIIAVNGQDIKGMSHEESATILKTATGKVTLKVGRFRVRK